MTVRSSVLRDPSRGRLREEEMRSGAVGRNVADGRLTDAGDHEEDEDAANGDEGDVSAIESARCSLEKVVI